MLDLKMLGMGAAGGAILATMVAWPMADASGYSRGVKTVADELAATKRVANRLLAERDQARAEVDKVNFAIAAQVKELAALMSADQTARQEAAARMEAAANEAAKEAKLAGQRALAAREVIKNVADQCARAGVPDDVVRVLRDITGPSS
jgi:seryl-tRNA synthetase